MPFFTMPRIGIAPVVRPSDVVPLLADQHVVARRNDLPGAIGCEDLREALAGGRRHAGLAPVQAGQLDECRCQIDEAHVVVDGPSGRLDAAFPHDGQGQVIRHFVRLTLRTRKRHAVVGRDDDQRVVKFAALFEQLQHPGQVTVEVLQFEAHSRADPCGPFRCRARNPGTRSMSDALLLPDRRSAAGFIGPVRLDAPVPEAPRRVRAARPPGNRRNSRRSPPSRICGVGGWCVRRLNGRPAIWRSWP